MDDAWPSSAEDTGDEGSTVRVDEAAEQAQAQAQKRRSRQGWAQQRLKAQLQNGLIFQAIFLIYISLF